MIKKYSFFSFFILSIFISNIFVMGLDYYQVGSGTRVTITEHLECRNVLNKEGLDLFVPTKTSAEWNSFIAYNAQWFGAINLCTVSASGGCYDVTSCTTQYYSCTPSSCLRCIGGYCCFDYFASGCGYNMLGVCPADCYT